ncbi:hypothetical protein DFA_12036 [Cavenderia fasciculata]|uniref:Uncharacterized protein n=1 Tax=Cavenderia fasciculata TaxID=261658 RepID=F4QFG5_CACFS|nr:uncharacterized protein DFA_12036 [Cavenderia fasciculata]EGG14266.1 hypothetical protein DFA_12036 [Cavenderia fasciculata]|eukprot:XP_004350975.1 hypothetical protein DFA_12036 [Cavenderia fasciculata]
METTRNSLLDNSSPFLSSPDDGDKKMKKVYTSAARYGGSCGVGLVRIDKIDRLKAS